MRNWEYIINCIEKLETLENGKGTELEFTYKEKDYGITSYGDSCDFRCNDEVYSFSSLIELGKSKCFGFQIEKEWDKLECLSIKPDFLNEDFDFIFNSY